MTDVVRRLSAEFLGTFAFVFVGAGAVVVDAAKGGTLGLLGIALAHAAVFAVMVTALLPVSGGHLNPAISFVFWMSSRMPLSRMAAYVVTQLAAAVVAALAVRALTPLMAAEVTSYGVTRIAGDVTLTRAILIEALFTLFLVSAVLGTRTSGNGGGGLVIGIVLLFAGLVAGPLTGAALNPARAFGPALIGAEWHGHAAYWIGPALGAAVGAVLWGKILQPLGRGDERRETGDEKGSRR